MLFFPGGFAFPLISQTLPEIPEIELKNKN